MSHCRKSIGAVSVLCETRIAPPLGLVFAFLLGFSCRAAHEPMNPCGANAPASEAIVTIAWTGTSDDLRVLVRDPTTVTAACNYIRTQAGPRILSGSIVRGEGVDPRVPFHYVPESVRLVALAIELCDSKLLKTAVEVDRYFLGTTGKVDFPSAPYCPWGARPVRVEAVP